MFLYDSWMFFVGTIAYLQQILLKRDGYFG